MRRVRWCARDRARCGASCRSLIRAAAQRAPHSLVMSREGVAQAAVTWSVVPLAGLAVRSCRGRASIARITSCALSPDLSITTDQRAVGLSIPCRGGRTPTVNRPNIEGNAAPVSWPSGSERRRAHPHVRMILLAVGGDDRVDRFWPQRQLWSGVDQPCPTPSVSALPRRVSSLTCRGAGVDCCRRSALRAASGQFEANADACDKCAVP